MWPLIWPLLWPQGLWQGQTEGAVAGAMGSLTPDHTGEGKILPRDNFAEENFAPLEIPKAPSAIRPNDGNNTTRHAPDREQTETDRTDRDLENTIPLQRWRKMELFHQNFTGGKSP